MNSKQAKKIRKEVRKQVGTGLDALKNIVRPRPRWIPKFIWALLYLPLFGRKYLKLIYRSL